MISSSIRLRTKKVIGALVAGLLIITCVACTSDVGVGMVRARALVKEIGPPPRGAEIEWSTDFTGEIDDNSEQSSVGYSHEYDLASLTAWLDNVPKRLGCIDPRRSDSPPAGDEYAKRFELRCEIVRPERRFFVKISILLLPEELGDTVVIVAPDL
jgi:hypothetical protein